MSQESSFEATTEFPVDQLHAPLPPVKTPSAPLREGLPAGYRMRADAHYVDLLSGRTPPEPEKDKTKPIARDVPEPSDLSAAHASVLLEQSLATLMACSTALDAVESTWTRAGVTELVRAETWRASSLSVVARLLRGELTFAASTQSIARIVDGVVSGFEPELRVRGITFDTDVAKSILVPVDAHLVHAAVAQAIFLTVGVLDRCAGASIALTAALNDGTLTIVVSQHYAGVSEAWASRVFDEQWMGRPGGEMTQLAAIAARAAAELHGGRLQLAGTARSTRATITIPTSLS